MPVSPPPSAGISRKILLIEDYSALAVAITSALEKFAPLHLVQVRRTFDEAKEAAAVIKPELFILDFDPPQIGEVAFFNYLRKAHPAAHMLVIAAGTSRAIATERGPAAGVHFVEKPFELAEFGAAVQALLNPTTPSRPANRCGSLADLDVVDVIQLKCVSGATGVLRLERSDRHVGEIHFVDGQVWHAATAELQGAEAFHAMVCWRNPHIAETERLFEAPKTVEGVWTPLLLEALRNARKTREHDDAGSSETEREPEQKTGKKIVVIDDTEMLLIFAEDILSSADPNLRITTAQTAVEGLECVAKVSPDLVLLDYSLPDLDGGEVCRRLLADEATAHIPVVLMSGHVPEMNAAAARYPNVVAAVPKPFFSEDLAAVLEKALAGGPVRTSGPIEPPGAESISEPAALASVATAANGFTNGKHISASAAPSETFATIETEAPVIAAAPVGIPAAEPAAAAIGREQQPETPAPAAMIEPIRAKAPAASHGEVAMTLSLQITAMELTPQFRMRTMRARPASTVAALRVESDALQSAIALQSGFDLGPVQLDSIGGWQTVRLVPTSHRMAPSAEPHSWVIGSVAIIPANAHGRVELTTSAATPMTVRLTGHFDLIAVELAASFEIAALVLRSRDSRVTISTDGEAGAAGELHSTGFFDVANVELDAFARIDHLLLNSVA